MTEESGRSAPRTTARFAPALVVLDQHPALLTALLAGLEIAVPPRAARFARRPATYRRELEHHCAAVLAVHGDRLLRGAPGCTWAFETLADGLALAAMRPGDADFAGLHWCSDPHPHCPAPCPRTLPCGSGAGTGLLT
jgi:hypothetical protein